jgi:hypothetical protein
MSESVEMCRVCRVNVADSYEHTPPRKALNDEPAEVYGIMDWLASVDTELTGGVIQQRGWGGTVLCEQCNNKTGSWYGKELAVAAASGANVLRQLPLSEIDQKLEPMYARVAFKESETGPHPLRFIKQFVTMMLAICPVEFSEANPDLGAFVLDRKRTGLDARYQFHLGLFCGPNARSVGGAAVLQTETKTAAFVVEVAHPPFAYVMTVEADPEAIPTVNITNFVDVEYDQRADIELEMLIGFGYTPFPVDFRTKAMYERDCLANDAYARGHGIEEGPVPREGT